MVHEVPDGGQRGVASVRGKICASQSIESAGGVVLFIICRQYCLLSPSSLSPSIAKGAKSVPIQESVIYARLG